MSLASSRESLPATIELDDRIHFVTAIAARTAITQLSKTLTTDELVMAAIAEARLAHGSPAYVESIANSGHSLFYHQLQAIYEFGRENVPPEAREEFCIVCGRVLAGLVLEENVYSIMQIAMADAGAFNATLMNILEELLYRYAGTKYLFEFEAHSGEIVIELSFRHPEETRIYLENFGLDPEQSFWNSFDVFAGAMQVFCEAIIHEFDPDRFRLVRGDCRGQIHLPIREENQFAHERLIVRLLEYVSRIQERQESTRRTDRIQSGIIALSPAMQATWNLIERASRTDEIVLLRGESGTGKSFHARQIHDMSPRCDEPFVEVGLTSDLGSENMIQSNLFGHEKGAFTGADEPKEGLFSLAHRGTIFLDEIGDASPELQAKLLRVLDTSTFKRLGGVRDIHVDIRIITATNCDLEKMVEEGRLRQDLYYRLNVITISLPPLRDRRADIPALVELLLARNRKGPAKTLAPGLAERFTYYHWPGNIRELDHALKVAIAMGDGNVICEDTLPESVRGALAGSPEPALHIPTPRVSASVGNVIDVEALRHFIRHTNPVEVIEGDTTTSPAHLDHAKLTYLKTLIEECRGDLGLIAHYWDKKAEKTLRALVQKFGLAESLAKARSRSKG